MSDHATPAQEDRRTPEKWSPSAVLSQHRDAPPAASTECDSKPTNTANSGPPAPSQNTEQAKAPAPQRELPGRFFDCEPEDLFVLIGTWRMLTARGNAVTAHVAQRQHPIAPLRLDSLSFPRDAGN